MLLGLKRKEEKEVGKW